MIPNLLYNTPRQQPQMSLASPYGYDHKQQPYHQSQPPHHPLMFAPLLHQGPISPKSSPIIGYHQLPPPVSLFGQQQPSSFIPVPSPMAFQALSPQYHYLNHPQLLQNYQFPQQPNQSPPTEPASRRKRHRKTKSLPGDSNVMLNKFHSHRPKAMTGTASLTTRALKRETTTSTLVSNNTINFAVHKVDPNSHHSSSIPAEKSQYLFNAIYPSIEVKKYSTSAIDSVRNYLTVYEYQVNNQWIIWDYETGYVHLTGIWKSSLTALISDNKISPQATSASYLKADIVKLLDSTPKQYHQYIKRIRGGFLKIQGTWLPYKLCRILARRFCYYIRYELIPIFGQDFPDYCLKPSDRGFGELKLDEIANNSSDMLAESTRPQLSSQAQQSPSRKRSVSEMEKSPNYFKHEFKSEFKLLPLPPVHEPLENPRDVLRDPVTPNSAQGIPLLPTPVSDCAAGASPSNFNEMMDIVNASKCLQSLRTTSVSMPASVCASVQKSPSSASTASRENSDDSVGSNLGSKRGSEAGSEGISSILVAAGLGELRRTSKVSNVCGDHEETRRATMKIDNLIT